MVKRKEKEMRTIACGPCSPIRAKPKNTASSWKFRQPEPDRDRGGKGMKKVGDVGWERECNVELSGSLRVFVNE